MTGWLSIGGEGAAGEIHWMYMYYIKVMCWSKGRGEEMGGEGRGGALIWTGDWEIGRCGDVEMLVLEGGYKLLDVVCEIFEMSGGRLTWVDLSC